jgi:hypothetical protein
MANVPTTTATIPADGQQTNFKVYSSANDG